MPTIVLKDGEGSDVGFLLVAGDEPLPSGPRQRDVVFMRLPLPSSSPLAAFLEGHKHSEFSAHVQQPAEGFSLSFEVAPALKVTVEVTMSGEGTWSVRSIGAGSCRVLQK